MTAHATPASLLLCAALSLLLAGSVAAQAPAALDRIEVVAAPLENADPGSLPAALDRILLDRAAGTLQVGVSEVLTGVPGLQVRERQNYAQDTQLSIRGVGARATFGIRGIRLYLDGIPATLPDGQGQLSHFLLASAGRIDVLRGPFSALYGNAAGGVIQVYSQRIDAGQALRLRGAAGSFGAFSSSLRWLIAEDGRDLALTAAHFETDGFRDHSAARRSGLNGVFGLGELGPGRLNMAFNLFDSPDTLDPLGLSREQWRADPTQAVEAARLFNTRKSVRQQQLGAVWETDTTLEASWRIAMYRGWRDIEQVLSVPVGAQRNPLSSGGVIDLGNVYDGFDLRHARQWMTSRGELSLTLGLNEERLDQHRQGFENFIGTQLGVRGAPRRDERNAVRSRDQYAQLQWAFDERRSLLLGLRRAEVDFESRDAYIVGSNPDDSGSVGYGRTTPVAGYLQRFSPSLRGWLSWGRGFETPTFNELSYRADGGAGLALDLRPASSRALEAGLAGGSEGLAWQLVAHRGDTSDELVVARNMAGRSSFRNVGASRRQGLEAQFDWRLTDTLDLRASLSWLDARFRQSFLRCSGPGCSDPRTEVPAGSRIPGIAARQAFLRLGWRPAVDWTLALETQSISSVVASDGATERAPGHALFNVLISRDWLLQGSRLTTFLRLDNLADRSHVSSVIVNESNGRFYEPGPARSLLAGLQWAWGH
jgi:iron complex outermembrane receptor protein